MAKSRVIEPISRLDVELEIWVLVDDLAGHQTHVETE